MGLWSIFGNSAPSENAIASQAKKAKEHYAQPDYRKAAMEKLLKWNTPESVAALLGRFNAVVQSPYWDEDEKRWLAGELVKKGELAKTALINFINREEGVTYAIKALTQLCSKEEMKELLIRALEKRSPEDHRSKQSKLELIAALEEHLDPQVMLVLIAYLEDHNDDVQCLVVDALVAKNQVDSFSHIAHMIFDPRRSARVLRHAAQAAANLGMPIDATKPLTPEVAEDYMVKNGKLAPLH